MENFSGIDDGLTAFLIIYAAFFVLTVILSLIGIVKSIINLRRKTGSLIWAVASAVFTAPNAAAFFIFFQSYRSALGGPMPWSPILLFCAMPALPFTWMILAVTANVKAGK